MKQQHGSDYDFLVRPSTCAPDDFWGQVRRTVNGKPVGQDQIDRIVRMVREALAFKPQDVLLDMCCGNGALSQYFFPHCASFLGVDYSPPLIAIAQKNFEKAPDFLFTQEDLTAFLQNETSPARFTKALWYGSMAYFSASTVGQILSLLSTRFSNVAIVYIGSILDRALASKFYPKDVDYQSELGDHTTSIGLWWSKEELISLAETADWSVEVAKEPASAHSAHYRFDLILRRPG